MQDTRGNSSGGAIFTSRRAQVEVGGSSSIRLITRARTPVRKASARATQLPGDRVQVSSSVWRPRAHRHGLRFAGAGPVHRSLAATARDETTG